MNANTIPLLSLAGVSFLALVFLGLKLRSILTPFHFCFFFFFIESVFAAIRLTPEDIFGRTKMYTLGTETLFILFSGVISLFILTLTLRTPKKFELDRYSLSTRVPTVILILFLLTLPIMGALSAVLKLGTFPIFVMARGTVYDQITYEQVFQGFITFLGWGGARTLAIWLILEGMLSRVPFRAFVSKHWLLISSTVVALLLNALDGQRNMLILPFILAAFAFSLRGQVKLWHYASIGLVLTLFFVVVGEFRSSYKDMANFINFSSGISSVDRLLGWFIAYTEPNFFNLDNLINLNPDQSYGLILLSQFLPDQVLGAYIDIPPSAVATLAENRMFAQPGMTLRTIFADLYPDFGALGSVLVTSFFYLIGVYSFNKAQHKPQFLLVYLILALGIINIPFMNFLIGIPAILPFSLLIFLKFNLRVPPQVRGKPSPAPLSHSYS